MILNRPLVEFLRPDGTELGTVRAPWTWSRVPIEGEFVDLATDARPELAGEVIAILWADTGVTVRVAVESEWLEPA